MREESINIGFAGLLTLLFIGLKLGGIIAWPWWWVLCPLWLWIPVGIIVILGIIVAVNYRCYFMKES